MHLLNYGVYIYIYTSVVQFLIGEQNNHQSPHRPSLVCLDCHQPPCRTPIVVVSSGRIGLAPAKFIGNSQILNRVTHYLRIHFMAFIFFQFLHLKCFQLFDYLSNLIIIRYFHICYCNRFSQKAKHAFQVTNKKKEKRKKRLYMSVFHALLKEWSD